MFNPSRLTHARLRRGMTKVSLAEAVGLTPRRIAAFENQGDEPPETTIRALASALGFPRSYFQRSSPPVLEPEQVSFRSLSKLSAKSRDMAMAGATLAAEVADWVEERFDLPPCDVPDLRDVDPAEAAAALRSAWGLGVLPAPNMVHLLEARGVRVFSLVDDEAALDAVSAWIDNRPFVFLTHHKSPERARWDAAHELGHLVLHLEAPPQGQDREKEADEFAREFLLPERGVLGSAARMPSLDAVKADKLFWKVSAMAYIRRLHTLGLITDWHYKSLVIEATQAGYRTREGDIERERSQLFPKVFTALREEGVGIEQIATELCVEPDEVRQLVFSRLEALASQGTAELGETPKPTLRIV